MPFNFTIERSPSGVFSKALVRIKSIQNIQIDLHEASATKLNSKIAFLNQTYVLHLIALWQVFIEDLVEYGHKEMTKGEESSRLIEIAKNVKKAALERFNTPNRQNIDRLFAETLGIPHISGNWVSDKLSSQEAMQTLDGLLKARHEIAHTGETSAPLSFESNFKQMEQLFHMAELTEQAVIKHLSTASACHPKNAG